MSNSAEEDRLSTQTEEPSTEEGEKESVDQSNKEPKHEPLKPTVKVTSASNSSHSLTTKSSKPAKMTRSADSPDQHHEVLAEDFKIPRKYVQINEENQILKRQLKKQEERIKILATKLIRVISDRSNKTKREEILLEEQKARIADLEHEVSNLRDKLQLSKQQLSSYTKLIPHHHPPPSRQASMLSSSTATSHSKLNKKPRSAGSNSAGGSQPNRSSTGTLSRGNLLIDKNFTDKVEELLLEAKAENQALEDQLKHCRQRLTSTEEELENLKETLKKKDAEHQEEIMSVKAQLGKEQDIAKKKKQLSDNIQLIRLQRESRRTASWLSTLEAQCRALETNLQSSQENSQQIESQLLECQEELAQEQQKNITLQKQMEDATSSLSRLKELEAQIAALQEENKILKETNESLLKKAFNVTEKVEKAESQEMQLKMQMSHLEAVLKGEMKSKSDLQQSLRVEKEKCMRLEMTNEQLQETLEKLNEEMKKYKIPKSRENERALTNHNTNIEAKNASPSNAGEETNLICVEYGENCLHQQKYMDLEKEVTKLKDQLESLKDENGRTKVLLRSQVSANKEYQREVEDLTTRLDKADEFHHKKLQDFLKVLEERTRQISHLEKCMDEWKNKPSVSRTNGLCTNCATLRSMPSAEQVGETVVNKVDENKRSESDDEDMWEEMKEKIETSVDVNDNVNTQEDGIES